MVGKNNQYLKTTKEGTRVESYSIKKFKVGTASVVIGASIFLGAGAVAQASEEVSNNTTNDNATNAGAKEEAPKAVEKTAKVENTKESVAAAVAAKVGAETPKEEAKLDKSGLERYVNEVSANLEAGKYANKTEESVAVLKAELENAKATLVNAKTQDELKAAYNKLVTTVNSKLKNKPVEKKEIPAVDTTNGKETVGKKAENTEKKSDSNSIENTGSKDERNGKEIEKGSNLRSANEGYTYSSRELRKKNGEFATATGKSYYELDGNSTYRIYVHGYQSENTEQPEAVNSVAGKNGRTDIPLSREEAQKLGTEAEMWKGKLRPTGSTIVDTLDQNAQYGSKGAYEFLATEIYGYTYEQGSHYIYVTDVKKRFSLSDAATTAGYKITNIELTNLIPGTAYNEKADTVEGYVSSSIQNGVYDMRYKVTISKPDGTTQVVDFQNLRSGWMGWQDTTAPLIQGSSKLVTIGDEVNHDIKYVDNDAMTRDNDANYTVNGERVIAGAKTVNKGVYNATFTAKDGSTLTTMNGPRPVTAHTTVNGTYAANGATTSIKDVVPGLDYTPQTGLITGTASEAGIFTAAVLAKDYNNSTIAGNSDQWNMFGQEAHENITIAVAPKISVKNVEAYATTVPVAISKGANTAEITMPDGTVTKLAVKNGKWVVAEGTTNTAVEEGAELADASTTGDTTINLTVSPESTKYVGVDNIAAKVTTDKVQANLQREVYTVKGANNKEYTATFNRATGRYSLPNEDAYKLVENADGTSTLTERRVYTDVQANGDINYIVYEFTRKWSVKSTATTLADKVAEIREKGHVTEVGEVTRTVTTIPKMQQANKEGVIVTVSYDSVSKQWTASDGSTVTATESNAGWKLETSTGFKGYVSYREASSTDVASIQNAKPTGTSTSYAEAKGTSVDLINSKKSNVAFADVIDDKTTAENSDTIKTKATVIAPDGTKVVFDEAQTEETAYIQAQRTAAAKTQEAATAIKEHQDTQNELARLQELLDRQTQIEEDAQKALDNLKLRSISPTARALAEQKLERVREFKASVQKELEAAQTKLTTAKGNVGTTRTAALEAERAVETARAALVTAAEKNLEKATTYALTQPGRYKVTVRAVDSNGVVTTPTVDATDAGEVTEDAVAETTYYIVVTEPEKSSGAQGEKQTDTMADNFKEGQPEGTTVSNYKLVDPKTGAKVASVTTDEGTYTVDSTTGEVTFTPVAGFIGTANPVTVSADVTFNDESGNSVTVSAENSYTPTVYGITPSADETTGKQGQPQTSKSGKDRFSELNNTDNTLDGTNVDWSTAAYSLEGANAEGKVVVDGEGTYSIDPTTGVVTFKTLLTFTGEGKGVNVQVSVTATDSEGNKVPVTSKGKYTPTVTPVTPTATPATSTGIQGETQTGTPTFTQGATEVPIKEGSVKLLNPDGTEATGAVDALDPSGKKVGEYTVNPTTGEVTFTPTDKSYTGKVTPANVQAEDTNGTKVSTTYTPSIIPAQPTAEPVKTVDVQGAIQTGKPVFQGGTAMVNGEEKTVEMDDTVPAKLVDPKTGDKVDSLTVEGEGTYTVAPDGTVTFKPEPQFTGVAKGVEVVRQDKNGTPAKATYTPEVKPVTPTGTDAVTEDIQGSTQTGKPEFKGGKVTINGEEKTVEINEDKPAKLVDPKTGNPVDSVTIEGEGTYTVAPDGTVTFTPEKNFTGKGTGVTVQREDKNGTPVTAKYTPVVKPTVPTSTDVITTNVQGATQTGTPTFKGGKVTVNGEEKTVEIDETVKPTFEDGTTEKKVPGEGTYTIDENGTVTFTPEKTFKGQATGVTVKRVDKNGTPVIAKYTPVVIPVTPTSKDTESEGPKGQSQSGTPTFEGGKVTINGKEVPVEIDETVKPTFEDGTTEKKVPGEGTYTIDENGKVTFTPEPNFVGKATGVTVKRVDKNGTPVTAKYTPTVRPDTAHVDKDGNPLSPTEDGTKPTKDIPGYKVVKTEIDEKGNTKHIYEKVTTTHKDKDGNVIPNYPTEDGEQPKKDIPGYRFVETKKLPNGDTEHVYEKVKTSHKDKEGKEIPNYPTEDGEQPKKDIPGYRFVETKKLPNGDIEHVYEKVTTPAPTPTPVVEKTTTWVDENGNPLKPTENGTKDPGSIPGYELVNTVVDKDGNVRHIFRKVTKPAAKVEQKAQPKRLASTGATETNTGLAGLGLAVLGLAAAARRRREK